MLALRTRRAIHESSYASFCAYIFRTQILTCVTLFTKLYYVQKIVNSCVNNKYMHDLSCRTTENFCKDSELMKLPRRLVLESQQKFVDSDACKM